MRIGSKKVVIANTGVAGEREEKDEGGNGDGCNEGGGDAAEEGAKGEEGGNPEDEVEGEESVDGGAAEECEESSVGVDGDGAEVVGEIAVEDVAAGNAPREVEFPGEVDEGVGPGEPSGMEHEGGQGGVKEKLKGNAESRSHRGA